MIVEELEELHKRYTIPGTLVIADDNSSFTAWSYDALGNALKITATAGKLIEYEEIPRKAEGAPTEQ